MLEQQFDKTPLFGQLVGTDFGPVVDGHRFPQAAGLGARLRDTELVRHALAPAWHYGTPT